MGMTATREGLVLCYQELAQAILLRAYMDVALNGIQQRTKKKHVPKKLINDVEGFMDSE